MPTFERADSGKRSASDREPARPGTEEIEGSTAETEDSAASETRIPNFGVAVMDELSSSIVKGNGIKAPTGMGTGRAVGRKVENQPVGKEV